MYSYKFPIILTLLLIPLMLIKCPVSEHTEMAKQQKIERMNEQRYGVSNWAQGVHRFENEEVVCYRNQSDGGIWCHWKAERKTQND